MGAGTAASGIGAVTSAVGAKALAGVVTAAVITAGAVEVKQQVSTSPVDAQSANSTKTIASANPAKPVHASAPAVAPDENLDKASAEVPVSNPVDPAVPTEGTEVPAPVETPPVDLTNQPAEPVTPAGPAISEGGDGLQGHTTYPPDEIVSEGPATVPSEPVTPPDTSTQVPGSIPSSPVASDPATPVVPTTPSPAPMPSTPVAQ